ncbi:MAG: glycosyl hydrolase family 28-related protein [Terriglobales bacterium]
MRKKSSPLFLLIIIVIAGVSVPCHAQLWSGILDPTRAIDWSQVGVGGIPPRTTACSTVNPNGSNDMTAAINSALSACASGQAVLLASGTFRINGNINVPANVTLRGAGANLTILDAHGSGNGVINLGSGSPNYPGVSVTGGATAGSTSITVSSASGISVGTYLMITELNDSSYVSIQGGEGNCTWCDGYGGTRARGQIVEVSSVSGTTIGFTPALYSAYSQTPLVASMTATKYAGVENLQVYANNTGYVASFMLNGCAYCWVKGVESNYTDGDFVEVHYGYRDEIRDSYFSNAYGHTPGTTDSDVFIVNETSATLVENNIVERGHISIMLNWGAAGNVISYNYTEGEFDSGSPNFVTGGISNHGAHPQFNLLEGNVINRLEPDEIWGSSSTSTAFRNWARGTTMACNPMTGRGTVNCSGSNGWWTFQGSRAISIDHLSTSYNLVGNVAGSAAQNALIAYGTQQTTHVAVLQFAANRSYDSVNYNIAFGYGEASDSGSGTGCDGSTNPPCHSINAYNTVFMHGNYTYADGAINWASGVTHTLPPSFYLSSTPPWWPSSLAFPAIGPDVTGGPGGGGHAGLIPAQNCYQNVMGGSEGGAGSPLTFNASNCYSASQLLPPTQLQAIVH